VGFFAGLVFAVLSYLFWIFAVALAAGSLGYGLVAAFFSLFNADLNVLTWVVGVAVGVVFAIAAIGLNIQKLVVIVATAILGAWTVIGTFLFLFTSDTPATIAEKGAKIVLDDHPGWFLVFLVVAGFGIAFQWIANRTSEIQQYNRWDELTAG
jgi:hypothetical protein